MINLSLKGFCCRKRPRPEIKLKATYFAIMCKTEFVATWQF